MTDHKATKKRAKGYFYSFFASKTGLFLTVALLVLTYAVFHARQHSMQLVFSSDQLSTIKWPKSLVFVQPAPAPAIVALHDSTHGFPTVNIIEVPGDIDPHDPAKQIIDSYRAVGLTDVVSTPSPYPVSIQLKFTNQQELMRANVTWLLGDHERHYVLTYLDKDSDFEKNSASLAAVMDEIIKLRYHSPR